MIAIKDFKMPSCCYDCDFSIGVMSTEVDRECTITEKYVNDDDRPDWCPLVEVPDMNVGNSSEIPNNSDCVSRRTAVEAIANQSRFSAKEIINICDKSVQDENGWLGGLKEAIQAVLELPSAQPGWIPCSERLPEEDTEVLISYRYKEGEGDTDHVNIDITSYGTTCFGGREIHTLKEWRQPFDYFHANYEVIAWMPLPTPYREE